MKFKSNDILYKNILIIISSIIIFLLILTYFLGYTFNETSLLAFLFIIFGLIVLDIILYFSIHFLNKIFMYISENEIKKIKKNAETLLINTN